VLSMNRNPEGAPPTPNRGVAVRSGPHGSARYNMDCARQAIRRCPRARSIRAEEDAGADLSRTDRLWYTWSNRAAEDLTIFGGVIALYRRSL